MISKKMLKNVQGNSAIRAMFEEGKKLAAIYGKENVYDFSLGNPNLPAPEEVNQAIHDIVDSEDSVFLHGYMSNSGYEDVREAIAQSINKRFDMQLSQKNIVMTVGAAGGMNTIFKTLLDPEDEVIAFVPYFGEYRFYTSNYQGILKEVPANEPDFQLNLEAFEKTITPKTKAVIINNPNNPTGVVYTKETIQKLSDILVSKEKEYGTSIYLISDEPYRELAYGVEVPYIPKYYHNTIVGYSFSKSLSLPGERIGYLVIPSEVDDADDVINGASVATRILGYVNAPSLMQRVVAKCLDAKVDVDFYNRNREMLYNALTEYGFTCVHPDGAFYLWVKSPIADEKVFCNKAKEKNILIVPGSSFGCPGYVRLAYCVAPETIEHALPGFKKLAEEIL